MGSKRSIAGSRRPRSTKVVERVSQAMRRDANHSVGRFCRTLGVSEAGCRALGGSSVPIVEEGQSSREATASVPWPALANSLDES